MAGIFALDQLADLGGAPIPDIETADPRYPFVFLVDTSGSTATMDNGISDIDKINTGLATLVQKLKYPPHGGPLAQVHDQIDVMLIAYSSAATVVIDWTKPADLPDVLPIFQADGGTAMGEALLLAADKIHARQKRYKMQGLPRCGMPHIFNFTDGGPTDVHVGDAKWQEIERKLAQAAGDPAKKHLVVRHLIAPCGYKGGGSSGAATIASWFGAGAVVPLDEGSDNFQNIVELVVKSITILSQPGANVEGALDVLKAKGAARAA